MPGMPSRRSHSRPRARKPRCGRPTQAGTPCRLAQEIGKGCRHHATASERAAVAREEAKAFAEAQERAAQAARTARRQGLAAVIGLSVVTLAILAGIGSCSWSALQDSQREAACEPHRSKVLKLEREATEVKVPLVPAWDPGILNLQLSRSLPSELGDSTSTQATESEISYAYGQRRDIAVQAAKVVLAHRSCLPGFVTAAERIENSPHGRHLGGNAINCTL